MRTNLAMSRRIDLYLGNLFTYPCNLPTDAIDLHSNGHHDAGPKDAVASPQLRRRESGPPELFKETGREPGRDP